MKLLRFTARTLKKKDIIVSYHSFIFSVIDPWTYLPADVLTLLADSNSFFKAVAFNLNASNAWGSNMDNRFSSLWYVCTYVHSVRIRHGKMINVLSIDTTSTVSIFSRKNWTEHRQGLLAQKKTLNSSALVSFINYHRDFDNKVM